MDADRLPGEMDADQAAEEHRARIEDEPPIGFLPTGDINVVRGRESFEPVVVGPDGPMNTGDWDDDPSDPGVGEGSTDPDDLSDLDHDY